MATEIVYATLTVIAALAILDSMALDWLIRPFQAYCIKRQWYLDDYFLQCDLCKGFWLSLWISWLYGIPAMFLVVYGLLVVYLSFRDRDHA